MNSDERKQLGKYYRTLKSFREDVADLVGKGYAYVPDGLFTQFAEEAKAAIAAFPAVMPSFEEAHFLSNSYYRPEAIRAWLGRALASLETELEENVQNDVVGPTLKFPFMADPKLRAIVERDYPELLTAFAAACKKSCLILAGGIIETLLLDFLTRNQSAAKASGKAPKGTPQDWSLEELIDVSVDLKPTLVPVQTMSHTVRRYRNLVHPAVELKSSMQVEIEEARVAISVLQIVHRELSKP